MLHVFIVNPVAGKGKTMNMVNNIEDRFKDSPESFRIEITKAPGHATEIAKQLSAEGIPMRIYSVGGDGTLNEIVNGISGDHIELGILPCGSGNDAVRSIYEVTDPVALLEVLPTASSELFDMGKINNRLFINIASVGFDAEVVILTRHFKRIPLVSGSLAYVLGVLTALIRLKKYPVRIKIDDSPERFKEILLCAFANGKFYGGGMKPAPKADMTDGILDICEVQSLRRMKILKFFPIFKKGAHEKMKEVTMHRCKKITIDSDIPIPFNIDGEVITETRASIEIIPGSIRVIIP